MRRILAQSNEGRQGCAIRDRALVIDPASVPNDQIEHLVIPELRDRGVSLADSLVGALTQSAARRSEAIEADSCG
jgi:hypothetical protein